jgi:hypothetical protein
MKQPQPNRKQIRIGERVRQHEQAFSPNPIINPKVHEPPQAAKAVYQP